MKFVLRPRYAIPMTVYEAARQRVEWLFDEFDGNVTVSNSGGKDSTVVLELAAEVARARGERLHVHWLDQECEFEATVAYQRYIYERPDIDFDWYQIPFKIDNSTRPDDPWLNVWGEGEEWVREKEPYTIHTNDFTDKKGRRIDTFYKLLAAISEKRGGAVLSGMRMEESPARYVTLTTNPVYKWVTWSTHKDRTDLRGKPYYLFHPIYDWGYQDVWKSIHDNNWKYNSYYDVQFQYGVPVKQMRVSNYHHEQALKALSWLQEVEPETWERATRRLQGINTQGHTGGSDTLIDTLPYMFADWHEYLHHLIQNLVPHEEHRRAYRSQEERLIKALPDQDPQWCAKQVCRSVLKSDYYGTFVGQVILSQKNTLGRRSYDAKIEKSRRA